MEAYDKDCCSFTFTRPIALFFGFFYPASLQWPTAYFQPISATVTVSNQTYANAMQFCLKTYEQMNIMH